jgi:hypothetical protein
MRIFQSENKLVISCHCCVSLSLVLSRIFCQWKYGLRQGILKGKYHCSIDLRFDWFRLVCFANKMRIASYHRADSKRVKQEVNGTVILPPLVFPAFR